MMEPQTLFLETLVEKLLNKAVKYGVDDFSGKAVREISSIVRFADNEITLVRTSDSSYIKVYIGHKRRRFSSVFRTTREDDLIKGLEKVTRNSELLEPSEPYVSLPSGEVEYEIIPKRYDPKVRDAEPTDISVVAINSALEEGAARVSGTLMLKLGKIFLLTSGGRRGEYRYSELWLNLRAFSRNKLSGHWVGLSTHLDGLDPEDVGSRAARLAISSKETEAVKPGRYRLMISPLVVGNFLNYFSSFVSATSVDCGLSPLVGKIGEKIASDVVTIVDDPLAEGNPGGRPFDDEGNPTRRVDILKRGVLETFVHNTLTAAKHSVESTAHAGIFVPKPHSLIMVQGEGREEELLKELGDGLFITNVWYTRFHNMLSGDFSSVSRDVAFLVKDGELVRVVKGARISDNLVGMLSRVTLVSEEAFWVRGWGLKTPVRAPYMIIEDAPVTTGLS